MNFKDLANLLFPNLMYTRKYYETLYKNRDTRPEAIITRYAPSPTGFQHLGGIFAALVEERCAHLSNGIIYLRIEDTDQKREVEGALQDTINTLKSFNISFDEGVDVQGKDYGDYGPYTQSHRKEIYKAFVYDLVCKGLAYPCFLSEDQLTDMRNEQRANKLLPGCYGEWAMSRNLPLEEIKTNLSKNLTYVIRFKSPGSTDKRVQFKDLVKGTIDFDENIHDVVIMKQNHLPTYHFAHVVDDYLMKTTHVIRGEEWLSSTPMHLQLFEAIGVKSPQYVHIPQLLKMDGSSKRKLSKRKDPEIAVSFYQKLGYPFEALKEYLMTLINSNYEDWKLSNPSKDFDAFPMDLGKLSKSGSLFDLNKLNNISKDYIASLSADELYVKYTTWCKTEDDIMYNALTNNSELSQKIFHLDECFGKRKDIYCFSQIREKIYFFYNELFKLTSADYNQYKNDYDSTRWKTIIAAYMAHVPFPKDKEEWFQSLVHLGDQLGYAKSKKQLKQNPDYYTGLLFDMTIPIRVALTGHSKTMDLHTILSLLEKAEISKRLKAMLKLISSV